MGEKGREKEREGGSGVEKLTLGAVLDKREEGKERKGGEESRGIIDGKGKKRWSGDRGRVKEYCSTPDAPVASSMVSSYSSSPSFLPLPPTHPPPPSIPFTPTCPLPPTRQLSPSQKVSLISLEGERRKRGEVHELRRATGAGGGGREGRGREEKRGGDKGKDVEKCLVCLGVGVMGVKDKYVVAWREEHVDRLFELLSDVCFFFLSIFIDT